VLLEVVHTPDEIREIVDAVSANYKTVPEVDLPHYIPLLCGGVAALITIPSNVLFNIFGTSQRQILIDKIFNEK
jgi:hypothetical protein